MQLNRIIWIFWDWGRAASRQPLWSFQRQEKTEGLCQEKHWGMSKFMLGQMQCWGVSHDLEQVSLLFVFPVRKIFVCSSRERHILSLLGHNWKESKCYANNDFHCLLFFFFSLLMLCNALAGKWWWGPSAFDPGGERPPGWAPPRNRRRGRGECQRRRQRGRLTWSLNRQHML